MSWYGTNLVPATLNLKKYLEDTTHQVEGFPNYPPEFFIVSHSLFKKSYIAWNQITSIDFLFFPSIHWFIVCISNSLLIVQENAIQNTSDWDIGRKHFLYLLVWFDKMQEQPSVKKYRDSQKFGRPLQHIDIASHLALDYNNKEVCERSAKLTALRL